ncbi:hypothetical protein MUJ63_07555 [Lachnospiraceae bacterium NSJ-143]|nr:hypothetical protein [Lachnospiraceae bacterium NSJ-143]
MHHMFGFMFVFFMLMSLSIILIVFMLFSLSRNGDERRKMILSKACSSTFYIMVGMLVLDIIYQFISFGAGRHGAYRGFNPFITLCVLAVVYTINLIYFKKKYGD